MTSVIVCYMCVLCCSLCPLVTNVYVCTVLPPESSVTSVIVCYMCDSVLHVCTVLQPGSTGDQGEGVPGGSNCGHSLLQYGVREGTAA